MNLTGLANYSREVGSMRNPSQHPDVTKRLIFTYPFGVDQSLVNIPFNTFVKGDADNLADEFRAFFSISVLKEIFISNALNLVTLASTFQRNKKVPEKSSILINSLLRGNSDNTYIYTPSPVYADQDFDQMEIQNKINQKFDQIKQSLRSDPKLKKFLPFMQVITLKNMIDVPVITGTALFQLDTTALFTVLAVAIATRTKLNDWNAVRKLVNRLKSMPDLTIRQAIGVLDNCQGILDSPRRVIIPGSYEDQKEKLLQSINQTNNAVIQADLRKQLENLNSQRVFEVISDLKDTKLKELERNFMFMMNPGWLMKKYGLETGISQASYAKKKVSPQTDLLFERTKQQFIDFLGGADSLLSSIYMILMPVDSTDENTWGEKKSYLNLKNNFVNWIMDNFDSFMGNLRTEFDTTISANIEESSVKVSQMKKSCDTAREDFIAALNFFNRTLTGTQVLPSFGLEDVQNFSNAVDKIVGTMNATKKSTMTSISNFLGADSARSVFNSFDTFITNACAIFLNNFSSTYDPTSKTQARFFSLPYDNTQDKILATQRRVAAYNNFKIATSKAIIDIIETMFYLIFRMNLCEYVEVVDVEFETVKNDVLDLPNYVLAIPVEVAQAVYTLYSIRNWKDAVMRSGSGGFNPLNPNYIKGVVKLLKRQLSIPNVFVFDSKKKEVYYSFQYMGNDVEKLKLQSMETFVKHHLQDKSIGVTQLYY